MNRRRFCLQRGGSQEHISQGSAATYLKCDGIIKYDFVANLPLSLSAKEFWKSVDIWGSYGQEFSVLFFRLTVYISLSTLSINSSFDDVLAYQLRVTVFAVITSLPLGEAKYCDDRVCLFVCLSARISPQLRVRSSATLHVTYVRGSVLLCSGGVAMRLFGLLPVLWMTSYLVCAKRLHSGTSIPIYQSGLPLTGVRAYYTPEKLTKTPKFRWPGVHYAYGRTLRVRPR